MRLTAENLLLLIARKKGYVSRKNQPYFISKRFFDVMRDFQLDGLVKKFKSTSSRMGKEPQFALTDYGELMAAGLCMLEKCPPELAGRYRWSLINES